MLAATPIGNLGDVSARLRKALDSAQIIAAEDTRTVIKLMSALALDNRPQLISLHEHNEREKANFLVEQARNQDILVLSDAGMPAISDPGFVLVDAAIAAGVEVTVIPGPSAVLTALVMSGLPTDRFTFEGFVPRKGSERRSWLAELAKERRTVVFFESPHRIADTLAAAAEIMGPDRPAAVCRELTKMYEEVKRGTLAHLADWARSEVRGEIVVVIGGAPAAEPSWDDAHEDVARLIAAGFHTKEAAAQVAARTGLSKRALYEHAVAASRPEESSPLPPS